MTLLETVARLIDDGHGLAVVAIAFTPVLALLVIAESLLRLHGAPGRCRSDGCSDRAWVDEFCEKHRRKS